MTNGVIHDLGYQRYTGQRLDRGYAVRSLYWHSLRSAFGIGRGAKAKVFPWLVTGLVAAVAIVVTAIRAVLGEPVLGYLAFPDAVFMLLVLFCAVAAPELVSRDLHSGVLPLYFSRPLRRTDYAFAKLAALVTAVWLVLAGSLLVMFLGGAFGTDRIGEVWPELGDFARGLGYAAITATVFGALAILAASLIARRTVAAGVIVALFLATMPVVGVLDPGGGHLPAGEAGRHLARMVNPSTLVHGVRDWLFHRDTLELGGFGPLYLVVAVGLVGLTVGLLLLRYRRVSR
ncbi:ABC transporter permease subunit [Natronosporangium hydrolyticum]|uniref:ABC transporter permease subunit n=1 Tax=Natronosporangium hydrolyticum TaxID=2811111 RepID=A0A895Y9Q7_9ACTN|nr:ABC transporter permease subunit [Natronosporangium hydrolyticum]QSB14477.1 ABC transporter permease subunit [Natronosporangium hydrolyticum]